MKTVKTLLKIGGLIIAAAGIACVIAGYMDQIKLILPKKKGSEFADYADVDCE